MENKDSNLYLSCPANSPNRTSYPFQRWCLHVVCAADTWGWTKYPSVEEVPCHPDSPNHPSSQWKQASGHHCQLRSPVICSFFYKFLFLCVYVSMCDESCPTLWDPTGYSPPGSSVHGILQVRILEWVVISYSRGPSYAWDWTHISCISCTDRRVLYHSTTWEAKSFHLLLYYYQYTLTV